MSYLTLVLTKKHLNLDDDFIDDDNYITQLMNVSEEVVKNAVNCDLDEIATANDNTLPISLVQAMLLMCGNFYNNREIISFAAKTTEIPLNYKYLIAPYKNYTN